MGILPRMWPVDRAGGNAMKILCKLGFHKEDGYRYMVETRYHKNGKKYHRNYCFCRRCGKKMHLFDFDKKPRKT